MYKKELKYIVIEYSDKDLSYIDDLCEYIEQSCDEIIEKGIRLIPTKFHDLG